MNYFIFVTTYIENSKAGNTETTDGNIVESGRDQHTNGGITED